MTSEMFVETLNNFQHSTELFPKSRSCRIANEVHHIVTYSDLSHRRLELFKNNYCQRHRSITSFFRIRIKLQWAVSRIFSEHNRTHAGAVIPMQRYIEDIPQYEKRLKQLLLQVEFLIHNDTKRIFHRLLLM